MPSCWRARMRHGLICHGRSGLTNGPWSRECADTMSEMYTQCPECQTIFRVTAEDLRLADGQVRCGHCTAVFSAIGELFEDLNRLGPAGNYSLAAEIRGDAAEPEAGFDEFIEAAVGELDLSDGDDNSSPMTDDADRMIDELAEALNAGNTPPGDESGLEFDLPPDRWSEVFEETSRDGSDALPESEEPENSVAAPAADAMALPSEVAAQAPAIRDRRLVWGLGSTALLLVLATQWIHFHRFDLVAQPTLGATVKGAYASVGIDVKPLGNVTDYDIEYWNAIGTAGKVPKLTVRSNLINRASRLRPYPLIRLVLEDRWGDRVGMRIFEPHEYLPAGITDNSFLAPNARIRTDITVVDPGSDAVGFKIDVCLRNERGTIICAEDFVQDGTLAGGDF